MPNFTPNYALPYPASTDEPCDFAQQWCDFTEALDAVLDAVQDSVDRIYPTIKVAILRLSDPYSTLAGFDDIRIIYDTVDIDTAGWVDTVNMDRIIPDIGGYVGIVSYVSFDGKAVSQFRLELASGESNSVDNVNSFVPSGSGAQMYVATESYNMSTTFDHANGFFASEVDDTSANTAIPIRRASLAVYWHSDV